MGICHSPFYVNSFQDFYQKITKNEHTIISICNTNRKWIQIEFFSEKKIVIEGYFNKEFYGKCKLGKIKKDCIRFENCQTDENSLFYMSICRGNLIFLSKSGNFEYEIV